jgi:hypothetical protein
MYRQSLNFVSCTSSIDRMNWKGSGRNIHTILEFAWTDLWWPSFDAAVSRIEISSPDRSRATFWNCPNGVTPRTSVLLDGRTDGRTSHSKWRPSRVLYKTKVSFCVHRSPLLGYIPLQMNPIHIHPPLLTSLQPILAYFSYFEKKKKRSPCYLSLYLCMSVCLCIPSNILLLGSRD